MGERIKNFLPEEITEEILYKLPVKSLLRYKCVSKQWRCLISSKHFAKEHLKKWSADSDFSHHRHLLVSEYINEQIGSCSLRSIFHEPDSLDALFIWNPATRQVKDILPPSFRKQETPLRDDLVLGFGYDESTDDYKVAIIFIYLYPHQTEIYSSTTGSWKKIEYSDTIFVIYLNGRLHWIVLTHERLLANCFS